MTHAWLKPTEWLNYWGVLWCEILKKCGEPNGDIADEFLIEANLLI